MTSVLSEVFLIEPVDGKPMSDVLHVNQYEYVGRWKSRYGYW